MAARDGYIYAAPQDDLSDYATVGKFSDTTASIVDMALNYVDGKLYAMDDNNTIYTVDFMTGALTQVATITIVTPNGKHRQLPKLRALAIDNDGTFYSHQCGSIYQHLPLQVDSGQRCGRQDRKPGGCKSRCDRWCLEQVSGVYGMGS